MCLYATSGIHASLVNLAIRMQAGENSASFAIRSSRPQLVAYCAAQEGSLDLIQTEMADGTLAVSADLYYCEATPPMKKKSMQTRSVDVES